MKVAVVGSGWYGSSIAIKLSKLGYSVTLYEKNPMIFSGVSGKFGIRLHAGPHYPRSKATREGCHTGLNEFIKNYPELINKHAYSIYGLGNADSSGQPSKVSKDEFEAVCLESESCTEIDPKAWGYENLVSAYNIDEASLVLGARLRSLFEKYLKEADVLVKCNFKIKDIKKKKDGFLISSRNYTALYDFVVNATGFQTLMPISPLPLRLEVTYQPCLALMYEDVRSPLPKMPHSFIVMDGWYPSWLPYDDRPLECTNPINKYILTHGMWTIMGSHNNSEDANHQLATVSDEFINKQVRPRSEQELKRFWKDFDRKKFIFIGWIGTVLAKIKTDREFRSAVTFQNIKSGIIHIIPGKVSNIFDAEREVIKIIQNQSLICCQGYRWAQGGVLDQASLEITEKPKNSMQNTCLLQTYRRRTLYSYNLILSQIFLPFVLSIFITLKIRSKLDDHGGQLQINLFSICFPLLLFILLRKIEASLVSKIERPPSYREEMQPKKPT